MGHLNDLVREIRSDGHSVDRTSGRDPNEGYFAELEAFTAVAWLQSAR
jgi:hypothetical protein